MLIPTFDKNLTSEKANINHILPSPSKHEVLEDPEELL
jgi:hypothetical protein